MMWRLYCSAILYSCISSIVPQNCREYSRTCSDSASCCGGCCLEGICKDTYADCRLGDDPCLDVSCPPEEECYIYQPRDCRGCGPTTQCRTVAQAPEIRKPQHVNNTVSANESGNSLFFQTKITVIPIVLLHIYNLVFV